MVQRYAHLSPDHIRAAVEQLAVPSKRRTGTKTGTNQAERDGRCRGSARQDVVRLAGVEPAPLRSEQDIFAARTGQPARGRIRQGEDWGVIMEAQEERSVPGHLTSGGAQESRHREPLARHASCTLASDLRVLKGAPGCRLGVGGDTPRTS